MIILNSDYNKIVLIILIFSNILISSCKNDLIINSVEQPFVLDSISKYDWSYQLTGGWLGEYYIADTGNIFFEAFPVPQFYDGNTFTQLDMQDPLFRSSSIGGFSKNTVYFGGMLLKDTNINLPIIKKWEKGQITNIYLPNNTYTSIISLNVSNYDELWATNNNTFTYYYNHGTINTYQLDSGVIDGIFFKSPVNLIYLFKVRVDIQKSKLYIYNYLCNVNEVKLLSIDSSCLGNGCKYGNDFFKCGTDILMPGSDYSLNIFDGFHWINYLNPPHYPFEFFFIGGKSKNDFISLNHESVFLFKNNNWSWERSIYRQIPPIGFAEGGARTFADRIYFVRSNYEFIYSEICKGKLK